MTTSSFVLVHSPLVGPSTWRWVAEELEARGHRVMVPVVPGAVTSLGWEAFVDSVAVQLDNEEEEHAVLVGHSGAGPLLPQVRARARREPSALVFVDAGVPPETDDAELMPGELLSELRAMACDGVLPRWSQWFGPGAMERLVPDAERRAEVSCELPQLAVSYFEGRVPAPTGWAAARCGYVQLSGPYAADAAEAATRGWPVVEQPGAHLDIVTRPVPVTEAILSVISAD